MTRDEFIDGYMKRSEVSPDCRTEKGFEQEGWKHIALSCACGDESCHGWAMVTDSPEGISGQMFYAPEDEQRRYLDSLPYEQQVHDCDPEDLRWRVMQVHTNILRALMAQRSSSQAQRRSE